MTVVDNDTDFPLYPNGYRSSQVRLSLEQLEQWIDVVYGSDPLEKYIGPTSTPNHHQTNGRIARICNVDRTVVCRWRNHGIPYFSADRAAHAAGEHPENIWPGFTYMDPYQRSST